MVNINSSVMIGFLASLIIPIGLIVWWRKKTGIGLKPFAIGAIVFVFFAMLFEGMAHSFFVEGDNAIAKIINSNVIAYTIYGALSAGIFEEVGRFIAFKTVLDNNDDKATATAYGIGHGGIEVIIVLGSTYFIYLLASLGVKMANEEITNEILTIANAIPFQAVGLAIFERVSAIMLHIGLSMIVFIAAKEYNNAYLLLAILMHALADVPACLYQLGVLTNLTIVEDIAFGLGVICLLMGRKAIKNYVPFEDDELDEIEDITEEL